MAKSEPKKPDTVTSTNPPTIAEEVERLRNDLETLRRDFDDTTQRIEETDAARIEHKHTYEGALDCGDEKGMAAALEAIRTAISDAHRLREQRRHLAVRLNDIERAYEQLLAQARQRRAATQQARERALADDRATEQDEARCSGLFGEINRVRTLFEDAEAPAPEMKPSGAKMIYR